jgi:serine protease AprX
MRFDVRDKMTKLCGRIPTRACHASPVRTIVSLHHFGQKESSVCEPLIHMLNKLCRRSRGFVALLLVFVLGAGPVIAGVTITGANGITMTGADGISYIGTNGITMTGADGFLAFNPNGITMTGADGVTMTGADGATYTGPNGITMTGADGITMTGADGITMTGADGITMTGADGTTYQADSVVIRDVNGITMTGADGITMTGADGVTRTGADGITMTGADGITMTGADGITMTGADNLIATRSDGVVFFIPADGITMTGADGITMTGADGITMTGADGITMTGADGITMTGADGAQSGLRSLDPELAVRLNNLTDDSNINAVVVYHQPTTDADIAELQSIGVLAGTRYRMLPMVTITAKRDQLVAISRLSTVRSIYGNRTLQLNLDTRLALNGASRVPQDRDLTVRNSGIPVSGRNVAVAVLDTGIDGTHADLAGRVIKNVKLLDTQSVNLGFAPPINIEGLPNTDQVYGHGTFVAGVIAGNGMRSGSKYSGIAPGARLVGLSAGDLNLFYVLAGFDYLLANGASLNVRVVNCSFSANTAFDFNDPVNVATRLLVERGMNVVFSAGNTGPGLNSLNPYAVAPWVISVGATDEKGRLAKFSSRGAFGDGLFRPTLVAPGVSIVSLRGALVTSVYGALGVESETDLQRLTLGELPFYTTASGTSFSAPQVAGAIALMLEANPQLTPAEVRDILQRTATPLPAYYAHEVGAGMLNAHAAVLESAFPQRRMGMWRATLDRQQVRFVTDQFQTFNGMVQPGSTYEATFNVPQNALLASVQIGWGPMLGLNDLGLAVYDGSGTKRAESNSINLPGLTGKRERVALTLPAPGAYQARIVNSLGIAGTPQPVTGTMEVTRVEYAPLSDLNGVSSAAQTDIYSALRTFVMSPYGSKFRPGFTVSRAELAAALVRGGRAPQYLSAQPGFADVRDETTRIFVESVQAAPGGSFFPDAATGGNFRPFERIDRLTAAIALVRAAGLKSEAEASGGTLLTILDAGAIPASLRGYVAVALSRGLLKQNGALFNPQAALTRAELAQAMAVINRLASE